MDGLSHYRSANEDIICEAAMKWCFRTFSEPDHRLMSRVIELFNRGNNTTELLLLALQKDLLN
jgi:hypothetical protein